MWIMLNNKPLDISKIKGVSGVITLDSKYYVSQKELNWNNLGIPEVDFYEIKLPENLSKTPFEVLKEDAKKDNKAWGYFFYIRELVAVQHFSGHNANGVNFKIEKRYSKVYSTQKADQTALEHFLFETNSIISSLPKIEI